jgi:hypothetical protein
VEIVAQQRPDIPRIGQLTRLHFCDDDQWQLREGENVLAEYHWSRLRYSISWKAYCFKSDQEQTRWRQGADELSVEQILETLEKPLRGDGVLSGSRPEPTEFALMLVKHFVHYPGESRG